jgi:hypothetical protein
MTVTYEKFVGVFDEFADTTIYSREKVQFWIDAAYSQINADRFGAHLELAVMLFTAHQLAFARMSSKQAQGGGIVGQFSGVQQSKSVGGVSVSYDTKSIVNEGAGHWNATTYGVRFYQMMRGLSTGPVYRPGPPSRSRMPWD